MKTLFISFLLTVCIHTLSRAEDYQRDSETTFHFPDDYEDEEDGDNDIGLEMDSMEEDQLLELLSSISTPMEIPPIALSETFLDVELLDESKDGLDEDGRTTLLKQAYRFNRKLAERSMQLDGISSEFNKFMTRGFLISTNLFNVLEMLNGEEGAALQFRETVLNMMVQAKQNIESINQVTGMYRERVIQDLGELENLPVQFNAIMSLYVEDMDKVKASYSMSELLTSLKGDVATTLKKEKNILRLLRDSIDEQNNLIALGRRLWVNLQGDYYPDDDGGEEVDDLGGGLKRNPTNEDILKQVLEVRRTRRAISAYSAFLKREGVQNKSSVKTSKDEL